MKTLDPIDVQQLAEGQDLEVKKAAGRDGRGKLPRSVFETYSAMANTTGGVILLGIEEKSHRTFRVHGIKDVDGVLTELWNGLNDRDQVSINLLKPESVEVLEVAGEAVIRIGVPRARRTQRPVHVGRNPLTGTFRRGHTGDYRCDEEAVRRMLAERVEESRDARILKGFGTEDLDASTIETYRTLFRATKRDHPWLVASDAEFLRLIGAVGRDRETGEEGITQAGLLMFGKLRSILDAFPYYVVDYRELPFPEDEGRWLDRLTTDGSWPGNLLEFHLRTMKRLVQDLKIPFRLEGASRRDEARVHEALREALTNTLIHADYSGSIPILVIKRSDLFGFRNPGVMRIPVEEASRGGLSDCRNRNLQKMFQLIGLGEQAGSGLPTIFRAWREESWRAPDLRERYDVESTVLTMPMVSLLPPEIVEALRERFGDEFDGLRSVERLAVVTAAAEGHVNHARLREISDEHPRDLTMVLSGLVKKGFLESRGATRATTYSLAGGEAFVQEENLFHLLGNQSPTSGESSEHLGRSSEHLGRSSEHLDVLGDERLLAVAEPVRSKGKAPKHLVEDVIEKLCTSRFLNIQEIAALLDRAPETIRIHYINPMVHAGRLQLRYPGQKNHPQQAYGKAGEH